MTETFPPRDTGSDVALVLAVLAAVVAAMAVVAIVWPTAARPMIGLAAGAFIAGLAVVVVREVAREVPGTADSPFDHVVRVERDELPAELVRLRGGFDEVHSTGTIPVVLTERLARCAARRLRDRRGMEIRTDDDRRRLSTMVSPDLYMLLTGDGHRIAGLHAPDLVDEIERL